MNITHSEVLSPQGSDPRNLGNNVSPSYRPEPVAESGVIALEGSNSPKYPPKGGTHCRETLSKVFYSGIVLAPYPQSLSSVGP